MHGEFTVREWITLVLFKMNEPIYNFSSVNKGQLCQAKCSEKSREKPYYGVACRHKGAVDLQSTQSPVSLYIMKNPL